MFHTIKENKDQYSWLCMVLMIPFLIMVYVITRTFQFVNLSEDTDMD